ncbi:MAG: DUF885 domain-containing protein [Myxococcota bacterium]
MPRPFESKLLSLAVLLAASACKPTGASPAPAASAAQPEATDFGALRDSIVAGYYDLYPARAVELGLHEFDGKLHDSSQAGLELELEFIEAAIADLEAIDPSTLDRTQRVEHGALLVAARSERFELKDRRAPWRNPMFYMGDLNLTPYIARDYAPLEQRAQAVIAIANGAATHLANADANLEDALPRTWVDTALLQTRGTITFVQTDVPTAMKGLQPMTAAQLETALSMMVAALTTFEAALVKRQAAATDDYALGAESFIAMLRETQGIDVDLATLEAIGQADLERNLAAMDTAAKQIDAEADVRTTIEKVRNEKPAADAVLDVATEQSTQMRAFLLDQDLISIPTEDVAEVRLSPPFMRWNAAFLDPAGPFSTGSLPSFYYISPPDPAWPEQQQRDYIPGTTDLLFITIHEVWPGHFLHSLHMKAHATAALKSYGNYAMTEGWAHYTEEMMWEQGISTDPRVRVGQLQNALLRNVRYMSAIGLHTKGMTVEQSLAMFRDQAFQDEGNAQQQAVRGTFDPMYLSYTLGKLIILKLRDDMRAKAEAEGRSFSLKAFHDELLSFGAAPLPVIREAMLGPDAGPVL